MQRIQDRVAVVTGASGGIGRAVALELARRGAHLAIQDLRSEALEETAEAARALGSTVLSRVFDVSDASQMGAFAEAVQSELGGAHILVNNAGVSLTVPFVDGTLEDFKWVIDVNLWGVVYGCEHFLPQLLAQDEGHLVNLSSLFGFIGVPSQSAYCAAKFAVRGLTESLQLELAHTQVGVTCVHPGAVATGIVEAGRFRQGMGMGRDQARRTIASGMRPERAAEHIVDAIRDRRTRLVLGRDALFLSRLSRHLPSVFRWLAARQLSRRLGT